MAMSSDGTDRIVGKIQAFSQSVEDPCLWRILIPSDSFDSVKDQLETENDVGTYYNGIKLCYTQHHDETRVEYGSNLSDHLRLVDTGVDQ